MRGYNNQSVCQYFSGESTGGFGLVHFVYEPEPFDCTDFETTDRYFVYLVTEGNGELYTKSGKYILSKGDFFFLFPEKPYLFKKLDGWKVVYLSFRGASVEKIYSSFNITYENCTRYGYTSLVREWQKEFNRSRTSRSAALIAEGLLLKTLSYFETDSVRETKADPRQVLVNVLTEYIDENFADAELSLRKLSARFHFHANYISYTFKEYMHTGIAAYVRQKRLHRACELLRTSDMLIKDVAISVGFPDALYFERCFHKQIGLTPSAYRENERKERGHAWDSFSKIFYL